MTMRVVLATIGKFHTFDLARQIHARGWLETVFTGYPKFKLKNEGVPPERISSFPWLQTLYMSRSKLRLNGAGFERQLSWLAQETLSAYAAAKLPPCDVFMALSGVGMPAGAKAQQSGATYICDRGSSHIRFQDRILREEYTLHNLPYQGVDPRRIEKEDAEYERADAITIASSFQHRSFVEMGIPAPKIHRIAYGVNLTRFAPTGQPDPDRFDVLFVGGATLRKGIPYLLEAFARLRHPTKQLTLVGVIHPEIEPFLARYREKDRIRCTGHVPQTELKEIMSRSHVMVLPSIEDGFGMVMAQAMACGCPVISTTNTGGMDLYHDGLEGFIVPIRDPQAIADRMQQLADTAGLREHMSAAGLKRVENLGGWDVYGQGMAELFQTLREELRLAGAMAQ